MPLIALRSREADVALRHPHAASFTPTSGLASEAATIRQGEVKIARVPPSEGMTRRERRIVLVALVAMFTALAVAWSVDAPLWVALLAVVAVGVVGYGVALLDRRGRH